MLYEANGITRFVVICGYTDLRKGVEGLSQLLEGTYGLNPFEEKVLFLFCGRRGDRIKALLWEGNGFLLLYKLCFVNKNSPKSEGKFPTFGSGIPHFPKET